MATVKKKPSETAAEQLDSSMKTLELDTDTAPKKSKMPLYIGLAVVVIAGAALGYFFMKNTSTDKNASPTPPVAQQENEPEEKPKPGPSRLIYSKELFGEPTESCTPVKVQLIAKPLDGKAAIVNDEIGDGSYVTSVQTYKNQVLVETSPDCSNKYGASIWYSANNGKTYSRVFLGKLTSGDPGYADQITSSVFSSDGKSIIFGLLGVDPKNRSNTVIEIDVASGETKDLFTVDSAGVFIKGYDRAKKQVYFTAGCYNCDGNNSNTLYAYDLGTKQKTTAYAKQDGLGEQLIMNSDLTEFLLTSGVVGEFLGASPPYEIARIAIATKAVTSVAKDLQAYPRVGTFGANDFYYANGKEILQVGKDGATTKLYSADADVSNMYYASSEVVVFETGDYSKPNLYMVDLATKKVTDILTAEDKARVLGVTYN